MATRRCVTDFSICESCCCGCMSRERQRRTCKLQRAVERARGQAACSRSWALVGRTPGTSGSRQRRRLRSWRMRAQEGCDGVNGRVEKRVGISLAPLAWTASTDIGRPQGLGRERLGTWERWSCTL